jgi:probable phosphoglycerate mutase
LTTTEPVATHLILVRHGQSLYNRDGPNAGENSGLTELGWRQAQLVADWLAQTYRADALVTSSLTRARQTAEVIGHRLGLAVVVQPGLEETVQSYLDELFVPGADPLATWKTPWQPTPQRAPIYTAFRARVRAALAQILETYAGKTVIVVAHGGTIGTIVRSLFGGHQVIVHTENTGITHLTWQEGCWRLIFHNSQAHLASPGTAPRAFQAADRHIPFP